MTIATPPDVIVDATRREFMVMLAAAGLIGASSAVAAAQSPGTRAVEHAKGITQVPLRVARVATDNEAIVSHLAAVGLLTVTGPDYIQAWLDPISHLLDPGLDPGGIALIGERDNPTLEAIAVARPDLIIVERNTGDQIYDQLSGIAPTVVIERGPNANWQDAFTRTVEAAGRAEEAVAVRARYQDVAATAGQQVGDAKVTFIRASGDGGFLIDGTGGFAGSVARDAGIAVDDGPAGQDADEAGFGSFSGEQLDLISGDIIVAAGRFGVRADETTSVEQFERSPLWQTIPAVQAGRVLTLPGPIYNGASYLAAQILLEELADFASTP